MKRGEANRGARFAARLRGDKTYFTGAPCINGHVAPRQVVNGVCTECRKIGYEKWRALHYHEWYERNRQIVIDRAAEWCRTHPDATNASLWTRLARLKGAGRHTPAEIMELGKKQDWYCAGCGADITEGYEKDHRIPISRQGSNDIHNIQLMCRPCNRSKYNLTMREWRAKQQRFALLRSSASDAHD